MSPESHTSLFLADPEKKKYFKIQANHVAPQGAQYSKETVKRKRNEQQVSSLTYLDYKGSMRQAMVCLTREFPGATEAGSNRSAIESRDGS